MRAGEKLHEELVADGEDSTATTHPKISQLTRPAIDPKWLDEQLGVLEQLVAEGDTLELVARLGAMMREPRRVGSTGEFLALLPEAPGLGGAVAPAQMPPADGVRLEVPEDTGTHSALS